MNNFYTLRELIFFYIFSFLTITAFSQVGIGTTNPNGNALLELDASATPGGLLLPRVALVRTTDPTPLTAPVEAGMAVYNTANQNDVTKGYYYHDGTVWVRIAATSDASDDWKLTGNAGTNAINNFIGTTDNQPFRVRTDNQVRFEFTNNGRLRSFHNGGPIQPTYSWSTDNDIGMYRIDNNTLGFSTNGNERVRIAENGNVGIGSTNPSQRLDVTGNLRLSGAFMPNNQAGANRRVLTSTGANNPPVWGADLDNVNGISIYTTDPGMNIDAGQTYSITVTVPGLTTGASAIVNIQGNWGDDIFDDITIHNIEIRTGQIRFGITNNSNMWNYPGMIFNVTIIR